LGCSKSEHSPVNIDPVKGLTDNAPQLCGGHALWGLWEFHCDPAAGTFDAIPLRDADMHLNALRFLEPPANVYLTIEKVKFQGTTVEVDIGLRHPYLGQPRYSGFDVCGILITSGYLIGFNDPYVCMTGPGDTRLLNPDGYSRWWNPLEFPHTNTMFGYKDGLLGVPYDSAGYNCTVNAYKYFCDDLDVDEPMSGVTIEGRGLFRAGQKNIRRYIIEIGYEGFVFNYAIDANWKHPIGTPPYKVPDDFPPDANRPEAYRISVTELNNTLWNDGYSSGGSLSLSIDVYDHFYNPLNEVVVESPGSFEMINTSTPIGSGYGYSTYQVDIFGAKPLTSGSIELLVTVKSEEVGYQGLLPGKIVSAYFVYEAKVSSEPPVTEAYQIIGLPDWCAMTEGCTNGVDNLRLVTNIVTQDIEGPYNDGNIVKWWEGHLTWNPPYSTSIIMNHINSLGYTFARTKEPAFDPTDCRVVIIVFIGPNASQYSPFSEEDITKMKDYVANGGILCILIEHTNYFNNVTLEPLLDALKIPLSYGGPVEPPATYTITIDITPHPLTEEVHTFQYWTAGEWTLESSECVSLIRSPTGEHMVVVAPIEVE
jgi:hypothetical protein